MKLRRSKLSMQRVVCCRRTRKTASHLVHHVDWPSRRPKAMSLI